MGQYYTPILCRRGKPENDVENELSLHISNVKWHGVDTHNCTYAYWDGQRPWFGTNGLKLMEHSYIGNEVTSFVMNDLLKWGPAKIIWKGDYSEVEDLSGIFAEDEIATIMRIEEHTHQYMPPLSTHDVVSDILKDKKTEVYLVNLTKKIYVDMRPYYIRYGGQTAYGAGHEPIIHPLPLLTAVGNGRGGGDYSGAEMDVVGLWAGDEIEVRLVKEGESLGEEYAERKYDFNEDL